MFAIVIPGLPVITHYETVDSSHFAFSLQGVPQVNLLTAFLTAPVPAEVLPAHLVASIYICASDTQPYSLLGALSAAKPSATFRVDAQIPENTSLSIGVAIEDAATVAMAESTQVGQTLTPQNNDALNRVARHVLDNLHQYVGSHIFDYNGRQYVDMASIDKWSQNFDRRIRLNASFWSDVMG